MLVVKVELWPFGQESSKEQIGELRIGNDGTGGYFEGNYNVRLASKGETGTGRVEGHPRGDGFWPLVVQAIQAAREN